MDRVWEELSRTLRTGAPYGALRERLGDVVRLPVPAAAWVAELLAEDLAPGDGARRAVLALVPREADALDWLQAVELVRGGGEEGGGGACFFPAPSLTPYRESEPSLAVRVQEAVALDRLATGRVGTVVATPRALFRRLPGKDAFLASVRSLETGTEHDLDELVAHLVDHGYERTNLVAEVGQLSLRGGIFDVFPPGEELPLRLDFFGDTLDSIRRFDPSTQRSEEPLEHARILPLSLFPAGGEEARRLASALAEAAEDGGGADAEHLDALAERGGFPGWEGYLPFLAEGTASLPELLPGALVVAVDPPALEQETEHHAATLAADFASRRGAGRAVPPPETIERGGGEVEAEIAGAAVRLRDLVWSPRAAGGDGGGAPAASSERSAADPRQGAVDFAAVTTDLFHGQLPRFPQEVASARERGERVVVVAPASHRRRLEELLEGRDLPVGPGGVEIVPGELSRGFRLPSAGLSLYGEAQLLPRAKPQERPTGRRPRFGPFVSSLQDLKVGDYVVHTDHGIGRFVALRTVTPEADPASAALPPSLAGTGPEAAEPQEVMELLYKSGKRLLVPLSRLDLVQKFSGIEGVAPRLDDLGGSSWNRTKTRVKKSLRDMADELLKLYAERQVAEAPVMPPDSDWMRQFEAAFAYEETRDQRTAIAAVREDLERRRPMDRLLCGDVGYGKTEVAMRAAFKVVDGGYQVAVLAPTTILADQHAETFAERFEGFPVRIEMISRFRTPQEIRRIRDEVAEGKVDVLIGTHRLLSKDVGFARLGLVIIDEEQRFGVAQKERLKQLKKDVHVLAMSATPVPRTLQLSLAGVRDMSVIETPPKDRMAIETSILPFDGQLVREAIEFEIERGGQVYYVYNRVESIERIQSYLRELVPDVRVTVGHGQLEEKELSLRMHAFTRGEHDVLLATTIIENGIDIPNVNTMIVHRADRFGLAQLYQLRGRVGRSNQLAYCYLLVPSDRVLSEQARKRLAAIREFTDLGAGFRIAARDLEIRGAGNLLGAEQSGHIAAVGIETYLKMLEETVRELRGEAVEEEAPSVALDLPVPMSIPKSYIADANLRMEVYRKVASGETSNEELLAELRDRFGEPPKAVETLLEVAEVKRLAEGLRVQSISAGRKKLTFRLRQDSRIDPARLIDLVSERPGASFSPSGVLTLDTGGTSEMLAAARGTLEELAAG